MLLWCADAWLTYIMVSKIVEFMSSHSLRYSSRGLCRQPRTTSKLDIQVKTVDSDPILHPSLSGNLLGWLQFVLYNALFDLPHERNGRSRQWCRYFDFPNESQPSWREAGRLAPFPPAPSRTEEHFCKWKDFKLKVLKKPRIVCVCVWPLKCCKMSRHILNWWLILEAAARF